MLPLSHASGWGDDRESTRYGNFAMEKLLNEMIEIAKDPSQNIMPVTIELVREGASMGDIIERLKTLWGTYRENPVY